MKCEKCGINDVNVRIEKNINGKITKQCLCSKCAKDMNININLNLFHNMFDDLFDFNFPSYTKLLSNNSKTCGICGNAYDNFIDYYNSECKNCNDIFKDDFDVLFDKIHESKKYTGKRYIKKIHDKKENKVPTKEEKIKQLESKLQLAVKEERYEDAAKFRDEIKRIK